MDNEKQNLEQIQQALNSQVENQKKLWEEEQNKAKSLFEHLRQESIDNFEQARHNIQRHIEEVNSFGKNLHSHFQTHPFDFQSFSKVFSDYHSKQLELLSQATEKQTQKLAELQNKLSHFYQDKQTVVKNEIDKTIDTTVKATKDVVEKIIQPQQVKNKSAQNSANKNTTTKSNTTNNKTSNNKTPPAQPSVSNKKPTTARNTSKKV